MAATTTLDVPHLGGTTVGYKLSDRYDASKPTLVMINSMCTSVSLYKAQFEDAAITDVMNLLAIEPLGHGSTNCPVEHFNYWDTATIALLVMDKLSVQKAFALGTSQGGWIVVRMALLAPDRVRIGIIQALEVLGFDKTFERILGLLPLGTSMDYESSYSRTKGCWDPLHYQAPLLDKWTSDVPTPDFVLDDDYCDLVVGVGYGPGVEPPVTIEDMKRVYSGDDGRKKVRMAVMCLNSRDGLLLRVRDVRCPVYWLQGSEDAPYGAQVQAEQLEKFTSSKEKRLTIVDGGHHYLNATNPKEVNAAILELVNKYK